MRFRWPFALASTVRLLRLHRDLLAEENRELRTAIYNAHRDLSRYKRLLADISNPVTRRDALRLVDEGTHPMTQAKASQ